MTGELHIVLLAAGLSTRMGDDNKLLLSFDGQQLIRHVAEQLLAARIGPLHVVTGFEVNQVTRALAGLDLEIVHNAQFEQGQMSSVRAGAAAVPPDAAGMMIALGDMPHLRPDHYRAIVDAFLADGARHIAVPFLAGARGNPIVVPRRFFGELTDGGLNAGCRKLVDRRPDDVIRVEFEDPAFTSDIDTPEDYARLRPGVPTSNEMKGPELGTQG